MINKGVGLVALPSSNIMLTNSFPTYKDHPFSWWEKKGVRLAVGTDNYVTLNTNFIREILAIVLFVKPNRFDRFAFIEITRRFLETPNRSGDAIAISDAITRDDW